MDIQLELKRICTHLARLVFGTLHHEQPRLPCRPGLSRSNTTEQPAGAATSSLGPEWSDHKLTVYHRRDLRRQYLANSQHSFPRRLCLHSSGSRKLKIGGYDKLALSFLSVKISALSESGAATAFGQPRPTAHAAASKMSAN